MSNFGFSGSFFSFEYQNVAQIIFDDHCQRHEWLSGQTVRNRKSVSQADELLSKTF